LLFARSEIERFQREYLKKWGHEDSVVWINVPMREFSAVRQSLSGSGTSVADQLEKAAELVGWK